MVFLVIKRYKKSYVINKNGENVTVSIDRFKPLFVENEEQSSIVDTAFTRDIEENLLNLNLYV